MACMTFLFQSPTGFRGHPNNVQLRIERVPTFQSPTGFPGHPNVISGNQRLSIGWFQSPTGFTGHPNS